MWKSIIHWPDSVNTGERNPRISTDFHPTQEHADAVCRQLHRHGFGMEHKIFPLAGHVESPTGERETVFER